MKHRSFLKHLWFRRPKQTFSNLKETGSPILSPIIDSLIQHHENPSCFFDFIGEVHAYNPKFSELLGYSNAERLIANQTFTQIFSHFHFEQSNNGQPQVEDDVLIHKNGHRIRVSITHIPIIVNGDFLGTLCFIRPFEMPDVSNQSKFNVGEQFQTILNRLDLAIWSVDLTENKVTFVSDAIQDIYGIPSNEVTFDTWKTLLHPDDFNAFLEAHSRLLKEGKIIHTYRIITPNGTLKWVKDHTIAVKNNSGELIRIIGSLEDITQAKLLQQKLTDIALIDPLTQLPNSNAFHKQLTQTIQEHLHSNQTFAVFYIDIDDLSHINHSLGHDIGDEVIKRISSKISSFLDDQDKLYREIGDTFIAIVHYRDEQRYYTLAQSLIDHIEEPIPLTGYELYLTASIGISVFPTDGTDDIGLYKHAEIAHNLAKKLGKGNYQVYSKSMNIEAFRSFQLESDLRNAFKNQELYFDYQPKVEIKTQKVTSAEALIRWKHPVWGIISPDDFIPLAESRSLIQVLGSYVIEHVIKQIGQWEKKNVPFKSVSFNLSATNFLIGDIVSQIKSTIRKYAVTPSLLEIEITEGSLLHATDIVLGKINQLKEMGIKISLDDFGTGYSSIPYLKKFPIDTLKVDRSFIKEITNEDSNDSIIVKSLIDLSKGLNKSIVAEGVETRAQFDELKRMGCDLIQGYLFSRPTTPQKVEEFFLLDKVLPQEHGNSTEVERRKFFRLKFPLSLKSRMTILILNNKAVSLGSTEILVQDIGLGGLCFLSHLRLTPSEDIVYGFGTRIMENDLKLRGKIVWSEEKSIGIFEYGVEFLIEEHERDGLAHILNEVTPKIKANTLFQAGDFIKEDTMTYIKKHFM